MGSPGRGPGRLVASLAIVCPDGTIVLVDATPDVREQMRALDRWRMGRRSRNVVDHIVLTHAHIGHYAGLVQFGKEAHNASGVRTWVTPSMAEFLSTNQPWQALVDGGQLVLEITAPGDTFEPAPGVSMRLLSVPHRDEFSDTVAVSVNGDVLYVPDIDSWEKWEAAEFEVDHHRVSLLDASFFAPDELPDRDMRGFPHPLVPDTIERFRHLAAHRRILLTHLNHSNPASDPESAEAAFVRSAGFEVATDGLEIPLKDD